MSGETPAPSIDEGRLREVVGRALGVAVDDAGPWAAQSLGEVAAAGATAGLWRVRSIQDAWSVVLKLVVHSETGHPNWRSASLETDPMYWRREPVAYRRGLLDSLDGGLRAARCLGVYDVGPEQTELWLEDVTGAPGETWPLERYELAARHAGQMQGPFLAGRPLPEDPWLSRGWFRAYMERRAPMMQPVPDWVWAHPIVKAAFPEPLEEAVLRTWDERHATLDLLDQLPRTVCHCDFWPRNLFDLGNGAETVAIDWAYVGIGPAGEDIGNLIPDSMLDFFLDSSSGQALHELVLRGYTAGLEDAGWTGDPVTVRYAIAATAGLKYVWMLPFLVRRIVDPDEAANLERQFGLSIAEITRRRAEVIYLSCALAEQARKLAPEVNRTLRAGSPQRGG